MSVKCLLIKPCTINHISYNDPNYIKHILEYTEEIIIDNKEFTNSICKYLNLDNNIKKIVDINNEIFEEEHNYVYDIMYVSSIFNKSDLKDNNNDLKDDNNDLKDNNNDLKDNNNDLKDNDLQEKNNDLIDEYNINELAMLINKEDIIIKGPVFLFKEYTPSLTNEVCFNDMLKSDLERLLYNRKYKNVVVWNDTTSKWQEDKIVSLPDFITDFFEGEEPEVKHIEFLMHNIHIYYIKSIYGNKYICGRLLNDIPIEKCLFVTLKSSDYLGNIYVDEVNKIIKISEKIERYLVPSEFLEDDISVTGRVITNNKYKILDKVYNKYY